jgi:hypothetical protein
MFLIPGTIPRKTIEETGHDKGKTPQQCGLVVTHDSNIEGRPSTDGAVIYLNCDGELDAVLKRAQAAGGQLLQEVAQLPGGMGYIAQFRDLDGNRVGLHATF